MVIITAMIMAGVGTVVAEVMTICFAVILVGRKLWKSDFRDEDDTGKE